MNVYISFDVEMWADGWDNLDAKFETAFSRYYLGRSAAGDYALPKTLEILNASGLVGVFFVEPLFSARFGDRYLAEVTRMITGAGQDVQLHLHPEWTDEIRPALIADSSRKRQHLTFYTLAEQQALIGAGRQLLEAATGRAVTAFRAGSFAVNLDTFRALAANGIFVDSSPNAAFDRSEGSIEGLCGHDSIRVLEGVTSYRVTNFRDGFGRRRPAHVIACSFAEMRAALLDAQRRGVQHFVIVSHNFEMLKPGSVRPDFVVVRRFQQLCQFLASRPDLFTVGPYSTAQRSLVLPRSEPQPVSTVGGTVRRYVEQALSRWT